MKHDLKAIEYPVEYCEKIYKLITEKKNAQVMRLNRDVISSSKIFNNKLQLLSIFAEFDENNDGFISVDEFGKVLSAQGFTKEETQNMFNKFDEDGNGNISFEEFVQAFEEHWGPNMQNMNDNDNEDSQVTF